MDIQWKTSAMWFVQATRGKYRLWAYVEPSDTLADMFEVNASIHEDGAPLLYSMSDVAPTESQARQMVEAWFDARAFLWAEA